MLRDLHVNRLIFQGFMLILHVSEGVVKEWQRYEQMEHNAHPHNPQL